MATTATTLSLLSPKTIFFSNPISIINQAKFTNLQHRHKTITFSSTSSFRSPEAECPVPFEQQPINEYQSLSSSFPFSWAATDDLVEYSSRLIATGASFALFIGLPVAWFGVINPELQPLKCGIGALSSGLFVVTLAVLRMYLGWAYVGNRLLSATVEYEETGWYDGQMWIKSAEVLARDRLLGSYSVSSFTIFHPLHAPSMHSIILFITFITNYTFEIYFGTKMKKGRSRLSLYLAG
ncbi:hypothetical protein AQUCO_02000458v1 [Aquilegia coerulea]|uniref:DUF1230 family protein n=1 Tax=Aquilegia coerulea TaxID=218851 RepID=A0A2G5DHP4_AQUCA|nr:hypothetical protein AQUCO_02000458v1 [Aquilegia coerulea]